MQTFPLMQLCVLRQTAAHAGILDQLVAADGVRPATTTGCLTFCIAALPFGITSQHAITTPFITYQHY